MGRRGKSDGLLAASARYAVDDALRAGRPVFVPSPERRAEIERAPVVVVTAAQNNTPHVEEAFAALRRYCDARGGALVVIPIRYKNPTSTLAPQDDDPDVWWSSALVPYLCEDDLQLHPQLVVMGSLRIAATAQRPLGDLDDVSRDASAIFGTSQLGLRSVPTPQHSHAKLLYGSGAITEPNYSRSPTGRRAEFRHTVSAVVVERNGDLFHLRDLVWDGEAFTDVNRVYFARGKPRRAKPALALVTGDEHVWHRDEAASAATFSGPDSMVAVLRPREIIRHDVIDGYSVNPHHRGDLFAAHMKARGYVFGSLYEELLDTADHIDTTTPPGTRNVVAYSNHHEFIARWLRGVDPSSDPRNLATWVDLWRRVLPDATIGAGGARMPDPFAAWMRDHLKAETVFLGPNDVHLVAGINVGSHGHLGPGGARGSVANLARLGVRMVIAHVHGAAIYRSVYACGHLSLADQEYVRGPSPWTHSNVAIGARGKRQMHHIINGQWRLS